MSTTVFGFTRRQLKMIEVIVLLNAMALSILLPSASSTGEITPSNFVLTYTTSKNCTLFGNQANDYCMIPWPSPCCTGKNIAFYGQPVQSGELIGRYNSYQREFFGNISTVIPPNQVEFPNNSTEFRLNQTAVIQIGMTVHFRSNSTGFCEQTPAKLILQNTTITPGSPFNVVWSNLVSVLLDCSTGTTVWGNINLNPFYNVGPCSSVAGGGGPFDCFSNSTRILTTTWGNNACTAGFDQKRCPEPSFNGQFFRFVFSNGDAKTQLFIYSIDLTITTPVTGHASFFAGSAPPPNPNRFVIELIWDTSTSLVDASTVITESVVTTCTASTITQC